MVSWPGRRSTGSREPTTPTCAASEGQSPVLVQPSSISYWRNFSASARSSSVVFTVNWTNGSPSLMDSSSRRPFAVWRAEHVSRMPSLWSSQSTVGIAVIWGEGLGPDGMVGWIIRSNGVGTVKNRLFRPNESGVLWRPFWRSKGSGPDDHFWGSKPQCFDVRGVTPLTAVAKEFSNDAEFFPGLEKTWGLTFMINEQDAPVGGNSKFPIRGNRKPHTLVVGGLCPAFHDVGESNSEGAGGKCTDGRRGCC